MNIESDGIDLDTGSVSQTMQVDPAATAGVDVHIAYNADRTPHAVVVPAHSDVELAFVAGTGFDGVSSSDIPLLTFSKEAPDLPFSANDCVVVRTDQGAYFKLGNATETGLSITFNYTAL
ncbi:MAG: hypothetical protein R3192_13280 [Woeseiaceae bacterium]|nr:hypothetical protein [Woeseiaceae bacterium]